MKSLYYKIIIICLFIFSFSANSFAAQIDYQAEVNELNQRLNNVLTLYKSGDVNQAKRAVQMAYFGVYENLEGPIRINYSAQYSIKLESKFGEIRNLITKNTPVDEIEKEISWLKTEINSLPEKLKQGHQLIAESSGLDSNAIAPKWQEVASQIDDLINQSVWGYKNNEQDSAISAINKALSIYTTSGLPTVLSDNGKGESNTEILSFFQEILFQFKLNVQLPEERGKQLKDIAYQGYLLTQKLSEILPNLPENQVSQIAETKNVADQVMASDPTTTNLDNISQQDWFSINDDISRSIKKAIESYKSGQSDIAIDAIQDTYFDIFEATGYENAIGAQDSNFKTKLEGYFTKIVSLINANHSVDEIMQLHEEQMLELHKAATMLDDSPKTFWEIAIQAFIILFREGMEAMLIVAAIAAYLVKNKHHDKMWVVKQSVVIGLIASLITAYIFKLIFTNSGANREILEGATMLVAVFILFFMSYWLLSKVEAHQWQAYLKNKLAGSLTKGSIIGLWTASFLAIYREGAETVLFYFALSAGVPGGGLTAILSGIVAATLVLLIMYYIMRYTVVQLPLKPFFMFTGSFMYLMAFIFAGKGVMELVEGKVLQPTIISNFPEITWLGIYPYVESLLPQIVLILAAILAWIVIRLRAKKL